MDPEIFSAINSVAQNLELKIDKNTHVLESILSHLQGRDKREEHTIIREIVVPANDEIKSPGIKNNGFTRIRIFLDAGFTKAHTGGISVSMLYKNSIMGEVMDLISSNGSCGKASEPIDIENLSGFNFRIKNNDPSNNTTVTNFRIVLYNEV